MSEPEPRHVLAGDVGGTKTNLAIFGLGAQRPEIVEAESLPSAEFASLGDALERFLKRHPARIDSACFGIAGPVIDGQCRATNLPWVVSEQEIRDRFAWSAVRLVNDLTATALAVGMLRQEELRSLSSPRGVANGNVGIVAPGTGLGIALLVRSDGKEYPVPSEGGHVDFAARNDDEVDLWRYLRRGGLHHVSVERVLSGPGIFSIYSWLRHRGPHREPLWLAEKLTSGDPAAAITQAALVEREPIAVATLDVFVSLLGAVSGNLALTGMTSGGIYLGGGIPPRILPKLEEGKFLEAFVDKGRFRDMLSAVPVHVILNDRAALLGAARCAFEGRP